MIGYCVEYIVKDEENTRSEYIYCFSLSRAEEEAQLLNWNDQVEEGSVHVRLMTDTEYQAAFRLT